MTEMSHPLDRAIAIFGSQHALAEKAGTTQQAISRARLRGRVSAELAVKIESATHGAVPACELRPDIFGGGRHLPAAE